MWRCYLDVHWVNVSTNESIIRLDNYPGSMLGPIKISSSPFLPAFYLLPISPMRLCVSVCVRVCMRVCVRVCTSGWVCKWMFVLPGQRKSVLKDFQMGPYWLYRVGPIKKLIIKNVLHDYDEVFFAPTSCSNTPNQNVGTSTGPNVSGVAKQEATRR